MVLKTNVKLRTISCPRSHPANAEGSVKCCGIQFIFKNCYFDQNSQNGNLSLQQQMTCHLQYIHLFLQMLKRVRISVQSPDCTYKYLFNSQLHMWDGAKTCINEGGFKPKPRDLQPKQIRQRKSHCFTHKRAAIAVMNTTSESKQS